ncbi:hypothetical protein C8Q78DRAFT_975681, partial [Trametes maxima]
AHQHAANADDYLARGLLIPAAEEHYKAAEAFQACVDASNDDNTKRTLRMLHNEHSKHGKDLQRKIAKLREENKDPALPQKPARSSSTAAGESTSTNVAVVPPQPVPSPSPQPHNKLSESQQTVDESFMLLGQRSDPGDAFHQFWKATEGMLEYLSRPVAFATAPLAPEQPPQPTSSPDPRRGVKSREGSSTSDSDFEDPISRKISKGISLVKAAHSRMLTKYDSVYGVGASGHSSPASEGEGVNKAGSSTFPPAPQPSHAIDLKEDWDDDIRAFEDDDMADSFCLIPSKSDPSMASLKAENAALRAELEKQRQQFANMELALKMRQEQDQQLRDSIMLARKEAQRAMISSSVLPRPAQPVPPVDIAALNINVPPPPSVLVPNGAPNTGRERDPQLVRRVRELEEELRALRAENESQQGAMIVRFQTRWEKLKEQSKRKKEAKAAAAAAAAGMNVVAERIEEEPEAEAAAEQDEAKAKSKEGSNGGGA